MNDINFTTTEGKYCFRCEVKKPFSEFHKHIYSKDGYRGTCKECRKPEIKQYSVSHKNDKRLYDMQYNKDHIEKVRERREVFKPRRNELRRERRMYDEEYKILKKL